jgi:micrococcal nuclease
MYEYKAQVTRVIDGDTCECLVWLGFDTFKKIKVRLAEINAPEKNTPEGKLAKSWLQQKIENKCITLLSKKYDKYGRSLGVILLDNTNINQLLVEEKLAEKY